MKRLALVGATTALWLACTTGSDEPPGDCFDDGDCDGVAICTSEFVCLQVQCLDSDQCGLEQYCFGNTCFTGCAADSDCLSGFTCNTDTFECEVASCQDTQVDCEFGQRCSPDTQQCEFPDGLCTECSTWNDPTCIDAGGYCTYSSGNYYCLSACELDDPDPPRAFTCSEYAGKVVWNGNCHDALYGTGP